MEQDKPPKESGKDEGSAAKGLRQAIPLHARLLTFHSVKYVFGVIGHISSMILITFAFALLALKNSDLPLEKIEDRAKLATVSALGFVFPDYISEAGNVNLDFTPLKKGWLTVSNISLIDVVQERSIYIREFRISPSVRGLLTGNFKFDFIGASHTEIQFKTAESEERTRFGYPINLLDIPAGVLRDGGQVEINDLVMYVQHYTDVELVAITDLSASLVKQANGYDARITARHADANSSAFSFRVQRVGETVSWQGNARDYKVTPDKKLGLDFDLDLVFGGVPAYDLTEKSDNVKYPYRYLNKADGLLRVKFLDWIGGGRFALNPETNILSLAEMSLEGNDYSFKGEVDVKVGDEMLIEGKRIALSYPTNLDQAKIEDINFVGKLDLLKRQFQLGELYFIDGPFNVSVKGGVSFDEKLRAQMTLKSNTLNRDNIVEYWPKAIGEKVFNWTSSNIDQADFEKFRFDLLYDDKLAFELSAVAQNAILKPANWSPRIQSDHVNLRITNDNLLASTENAKSVEEDGVDINLSDVQFWMPDFKTKPSPAQVTARFSGNASDVVKLLSSEPINLSSRMNMAANRFSGFASGKVAANFTLKKGTQLSEIDLSVKSNVKNFALSNLVNGQDLRANSVNIDVTENDVKISGDANLGQMSTKLSVGQSFSKGAQPDIQASGRASKRQLSSVGVNLPSIVSGDGIGYNVKIKPKGKAIEISGSADVKSLGLKIASLGTAKSVGQSGKVDFTALVNGSNVTLNPLKLKAGNLSASGSVDIKSGRMVGMNLSSVNWPGRYKGKVAINSGGDVTLSGGQLNLTGISANGASSGGRKQNVVLQNVRVQVTNKIALSSVKGKAQIGSTTSGDFTGLFAGRTQVAARIRPYGKYTMATITSNNAGAVVRDAGFFGDLHRGNFKFQVRTTERAGLYAGKFKITRSLLSNSRTAVQLLQTASVFGLLDKNGIWFDEIGGDVLIYSNRIDLFSGRAFGPSLGLTLGGSYVPSSAEANFAGVLTPAYLFNGAFQRIPGFGELLGGNVGEGVFGVTYQIKGRSPNYQIQANPLSLLTPGKFREIWSNVPQRGTIPQKYRIE